MGEVDKMIISFDLLKVIQILGLCLTGGVLYASARVVGKILDGLGEQGRMFYSIPMFFANFGCYLLMAGVGICLVHIGQIKF